MSAEQLQATAAQLWWRHARWPLLAFLAAASLFAVTDLDMTIARAAFFDSASHRWLGAGNWWVNEVVHTGGRWAVRLGVAIALALWIASYLDQCLQGLRRRTAYFALAVIITVSVVGLLKAMTNVDCPWDLQAFGGRFPYVDLFSARPVDLRRGQCFPAAHASSGYALMALYFVARERNRTLAILGLAVGVLLGLSFGVAQQARGAHFASHDLWSAFLAWIIPLTLYVFVFRGRLHPQQD